MIKFKQVGQNPYAPKGSVWWEDEHGPSVHVEKPGGGKLTFVDAKAAYFRHMRWKEGGEFEALDDVIERQPDSLKGFDMVDKGMTGYRKSDVHRNRASFRIGAELVNEYDLEDGVLVLVDPDTNRVAFKKPEEGDENAYSIKNSENALTCSSIRHYLDVDLEGKETYEVEKEEDKFIIQL